MAIRAKTEMDQVKHGRHSCNPLKSHGILRGRSLKICCLHGHGVHVVRRQRCVLEQALAQMREVSVEVPRRRHALIDLKHVDALPRDISTGKRPQHHPWRVTAANREGKAAAAGDCLARGRGNSRCSRSGN